MNVSQLTDREEIHRFLESDRYLHIYELGDLDDFFWPYTTWYGLKKEGRIQSLLLIYQKSSLPVLLAFETPSTSSATKSLFSEVRDILPDHFYTHMTEGVLNQAQHFFRFENIRTYHKMKLVEENGDSISNSVDGRVRVLKEKDLEQILDLYHSSYPGHWFEPHMLASKKYYGRFIGGNQLVAIAGVHVYSETYGVAALGNIVTARNHRGKGYGREVTAALCIDLQAHVDSIGLNVAAENVNAISLYQSLGFRFHSEYFEADVYRKDFDLPSSQGRSL